ncbi:hypothetical protein CALCODRAFT_500745 [Calocera cornea HHB12733]|uniref:ShKT domain-containing protein n=1 Tax=Calocera cornea HHB12733 TaxID=1353952 RepID=A0A165DWX7_9BASI|nr:hypothetical protein CALCODRAFT_500745 [Calocera cornea HHB12733]
MKFGAIFTLALFAAFASAAPMPGGDKASDCASKKHLCTNKLYMAMMKAQCARTCGYH